MHSLLPSRALSLGLLLTLPATLAFAAEPPSQGVVLAAEPRTFAEANALPPKLSESAPCDLGLGRTPDITVSQSVTVDPPVPSGCLPAVATVTQELALPDGSRVQRVFRIVDDAPGTQLPPPPPRPRVRVRCQSRRLELSVEGVPEAPVLMLEPIAATGDSSVRLRVSRDNEARFLPLLIRDDAGARKALEELAFLVSHGVPSRFSKRDANVPEADSVAALAAAFERARKRSAFAAGDDVEPYVLRDALAPDWEQEGDRPPLKVGAPEDIGEVRPPDPYSDSDWNADLFWRQGRLCVVQQDTGKRMRCYDPVARRWGKAVPVNRGDLSDWNPRMGSCGIPLGTRTVRPPEGYRLGLRLSPRAVLLWGVHTHEALLLEVPEGDGPPRLRPPEAEALKKAMLASPGSRLLGEGRFMLNEGRKAFCSVRRPLGCWSLREEEGGNELSQGRVSPDGRWLAYLRGPSPSRIDEAESTLTLVVRSLELGPYVAPREPVSMAPPLVRTDVVMEKLTWLESGAPGPNGALRSDARIACDLGQDPRIPFELETTRAVSSNNPASASADSCSNDKVRLYQELRVPGGLKFSRSAFVRAGDRRSPVAEVKVRCQPGRLSLWVEGVPDFPALTLAANPGAFGAVRWELAPETEGRLQALLARDDAPAREALDAFAKLVKQNEDGRISRMGCLSTALEAIPARLALADGFHPELHVVMKTDGACAERYGLRALQQRLQAATPPPPLRVGAVKDKPGVIGQVRSFPNMPPERWPQLYWRDATLCRVQEEGSGQVRCYDPVARKWGPTVAMKDRPVPREDLFVSSWNGCYPLGGRTVPLADEMHEVMPLSPRASLFTDTSRGDLAPEFKVLEVPEDAGPVRTRAPTVEELALAARSGGGSISLGNGGLLLHDPRSGSLRLCTAVRPLMCWKLDLETGNLIARATVSPDGRWLSYVWFPKGQSNPGELVVLPLLPGGAASPAPKP
ncbi:hypothetical protein [Corallococcus carmarthensis]|uniref:Biopolymer transporter Tol n=1 Tax=Corallococcus carmarthensis TaxID=2316728 RepID=A0A3A8K5K2_9BACT|nr:hypothetical protein [Corallococcus carmarthensis]NOK17391.1 hypothetical protein [Corallococcus carmarthensis]RKH03423.1 hypothetical protein D7X32_14100 [Corallococcus carmarthensis]